MRARVCFGFGNETRIPTNVKQWIIGIIGIGSIIFGIVDAVFLHPFSYPAAVTVSNITARYATVSFVTKETVRLCVVAIPTRLSPVRISCDSSARLVHSIPLPALRSGTTYNLFVGRIFRWTRKGIDPVNGVLAHASYVPHRFSSFTTTKSIDGELIMSASPQLFGRITTSDHTQQVPQGKALVVVRLADDSARWSTTTNALGQFAILLPGAKPTSEVGLTVWSSRGYATASGVVLELGMSELIIPLKEYE